MQPEYSAPLVVAEGAFSDLDALDFSDFLDNRGFTSVWSQFQIGDSSSRSVAFGVSYRELHRDDELIYSEGDHQELFPWLFRQRLVPEPSGSSWCISTFALVTILYRRVTRARVSSNFVV